VRPGDLTVNVIVEIAFANNLVARSVPKARLVSASRTEEGGAVHIQAAIRERETSFSALRKSYKWDRGERRFLATMCLIFFFVSVSLVTEVASVALTKAARNLQLADHSRALAMEAEGAVLWRVAINQRSRPQSIA
jgi:hypothetical protein